MLGIDAAMRFTIAEYIDNYQTQALLKTLKKINLRFGAQAKKTIRDRQTGFTSNLFRKQDWCRHRDMSSSMALPNAQFEACVQWLDYSRRILAQLRRFGSARFLTQCTSKIVTTHFLEGNLTISITLKSHLATLGLVCLGAKEQVQRPALLGNLHPFKVFLQTVVSILLSCMIPIVSPWLRLCTRSLL